MKKKLLILIPILIICVFWAIPDRCRSMATERCNNRAVENSKYCEEHTCSWEGCTELKYAWKKYCSVHAEQNYEEAQKEREANMIEFTESQLQQARSAVDEYIQLLMSKQSYIKDVSVHTKVEQNDLNDLHFFVTVFMDDDTYRKGKIWVGYSKDTDTFKVLSLLYD